MLAAVFGELVRRYPSMTIATASQLQSSDSNGTSAADWVDADLPAQDLMPYVWPSDRAQEEEFRELRTKAIASGVAGAVAMVISMPLMSTMSTAAGDHKEAFVIPTMG